MATTWIKAVHRTNSGSISAAIKSTVEYAENADKTQGGELVAAYECDPMTAQSEFMLSKRQYELRTGRNQGQHDVIGYQIRQSFKPGEVTAQQALDIGCELAMRWTHGKHQFIVAAHTNTDNPHTHIFFNSVTLDHSRKFQDFKRSAIALRRVSDMICVENGLSIIDNPGLSKGYNRAEYLGDRKPPTGRDKLRDMIDNSLRVGMSFPDLLVALRKAGCEIKIGKQPSIKPPGSKKFFRLDTVGEDYSQEAIMERLAGKRDVVPRKKSEDDSERKAAEYMAAANQQKRPSLLIDIQAKIQEGAGDAYVQWMRIFNLKTAPNHTKYK
ncbi:MAG: relaxase/mobilization nuclease domain-containing protein [Oscillospiraceae bacterium]|nr:relaxase/mobilization nuclease domain-containing protein [Oscillospiraceae bacterium]